MGKLNFRKFSDVSTVHITFEDSQKLDVIASRYNSGDGAPLGCPIIYKYEEGYFIYAGADQDQDESGKEIPVYGKQFEQEGLSKEFLALLQMTSDEGMAYLNLDRDGTDYDFLPAFEW